MLGLHIYSVGSNPEAARLSGIKVWKVLLFVYAMSGLLAGLGAVMASARLMAANGLQLGQSYELDAIAAVILGGTSFVGGVGSILGTLIGALIIAVLSNGLVLLGVSDIWQYIIKAWSSSARSRSTATVRAAPAPEPTPDPARRFPIHRAPDPGPGSRSQKADRSEETPMFHRKLVVAGIALALASGFAQAREIKSVGVTVGSLGNPFFVTIAKGAEAKVKELNPSAKVLAVSADYDLNKQFTQIDNFIAAGVDMILLNAADPKAIEPAVKKAQKAGIAVVGVDVAAAGATPRCRPTTCRPAALPANTSSSVSMARAT